MISKVSHAFIVLTIVLRLSSQIPNVMDYTQSEVEGVTWNSWLPRDLACPSVTASQIYHHALHKQFWKQNSTVLMEVIISFLMNRGIYAEQSGSKFRMTWRLHPTSTANQIGSPSGGTDLNLSSESYIFRHPSRGLVFTAQSHPWIVDEIHKYFSCFQCLQQCFVESSNSIVKRPPSLQIFLPELLVCLSRRCLFWA